MWFSQAEGVEAGGAGELPAAGRTSARPNPRTEGRKGCGPVPGSPGWGAAAFLPTPGHSRPSHRLFSALGLRLPVAATITICKALPVDAPRADRSCIRELCHSSKSLGTKKLSTLSPLDSYLLYDGVSRNPCDFTVTSGGLLGSGGWCQAEAEGIDAHGVLADGEGRLGRALPAGAMSLLPAQHLCPVSCEQISSWWW